MTAKLVLDRLTAGYGVLQVIHEIGLSVGAGEVVCLLGPNGAGKTTTLLAAVGQGEATAGRVTVNGRAISHRHPNRTAALGVAFVPDNRGLFLQLTVAEDLTLVHPLRLALRHV